MQSKHFFFLILYFISQISFAQDAGYLDESFGDNGIVITAPYNLSSMGKAMAIHGDGKIIMGGTLYVSGDNDFVFAQYLESGALDETFSDDGLLRLNYPGSDDYVNDIVVQDDEKIVAVGTTSNETSADFAVIRLNEDGSFDNSFSNDGIAIIDFGTNDYGRAVALQEDGKIILAGYTGAADEWNRDLAVCRLNTDGTPDNTFGSNGKVIFDVNWESDDWMNDVTVYNGNIFASGYSYSSSGNREEENVVVVKMNESGQIDNSFGDQGVAMIALPTLYQVYVPGSKLAINENGIYVAATRSDSWSRNISDIALINFLHNGYPNENFGIHGLVITEMVVSSGAESILLQPDSKIVVGGFAEDNNEKRNFCLARYLENGDLDADFGAYYGAAILDVSPDENDFITDIAMQEDGKIIAAGMADNYNKFALTRFYSGLEVGVTEMNTDNSFNPHIKNPVVRHQLDMTVEFTETSEVEARLFDMEGHDAGLELHETFKVGTHRLVYDLRPDLPRGIYLLQMTVNGQRKSFRLLIQ